MTLAEPEMEVELEAFERDELEEQWSAAVRQRLVGLGLQVGEDSQAPSFHGNDLGDLLLTDWHCPPVHGVRTARMADADDEALVVMTAQVGEMGIVIPDQTETLRPGSVLLLRSRVSGQITVPRWLVKRSIRLPLGALAPFCNPNRIPDLFSVDAADSPVSSLLLDFMSDVERERTRLDPAGVEATRNALLALVAGVVQTSQSPALESNELLPGLRRQMEKWVADHLADGAVRVRDLAAAYNVAPRTVHRAFASTGDTFGSVVRAQRIAAARNDLVQSSLSIASIAYRWGFCDASHFGREFRRAMSMSPGDYRDAFRAA